MSGHTWRELERADMDTAAAHRFDGERRAAMTELLPCPFCGGNAKLTTWTPTAASISCIMCGAHFNTYTEAEAIAAWNSRSDYHGYEQAAIEAWESIKAWNSRSERTCRIVEYDEVPFPVCSECGAVQPDDFTVYYCWSCGAKVVGE